MAPTSSSGWFAVGAILNLVAATAFEVLRPNGLTYDGLWNARSGFWAGLLLLDNLCVLWWYAERTQQLARTAEGQLGFQVSQWRVANKPIVFLDGEVDDHDTATSVAIMARNFGPGLAVNVYILEQLDNGKWKENAVGAIEAGGTRQLPFVIDARLDPHAGRQSGRVVIAEAIRTRTNQWIVTLNVRDRQGAVRHRLVEFAAETELSLQQLIEQHGTRFGRELSTFRTEVEA